MKRKRFPRKRSFKRRSGLGRTGGWLNKTSGRRGPELKWLDNQPTITPNWGDINTQFICCNAMTQGATQNQRIGQQVVMKSILIRFTMKFNYTIASVAFQPLNQQYRYILVLDKQANGVANTSLDDVLPQKAVAGVTDMPLNLYNRDRFVVLVDKVCTSPLLASVDTTALSQTIVRKHKIYKKKMNTVVQFDSTASGTQANIRTNSLIFMLINETASTTTPVAMTALTYFRLRYVDP